MSFWPFAIAIPVIAAVFMLWPLLRGKPALQGIGAVLLLLIPITTLFLYQGVGSPESIDFVAPQPTAQAGGEETMDQLLAELEARLEQNPGDLQGWLLLGRSYKAMRRYDEALAVLQRATQLAPDDPLVLVELAEAMIFTSGSPDISAEVRTMLEQAVAQEPEQQKGLWLLGVTAFQGGDYEGALAYWERLMRLVEPDSGIAQSVQQQLNEAHTRLGQEAGTQRGPAMAGPWRGVEATVSTVTELAEVPAGAVLFVIARDPAAPRPPLGAVRVPNPEFPVTVRITDANSMMPQRPVSGVAEIELLARLSLSGQPTATEGDWQSSPARVERTNSPKVELLLAAPGN